VLRLPLVLAAAAALISSAPAGAQQRPDSTTVIAGEQYEAGFLQRSILGRHYRDLWVTPIRVEILDLETFAGGITPTRTGGGQQTRSLRFLGADGREYSFRSVDKDPSAVLDTLLLNTVVDALVQDGISAAHPFGALVAAPLLDAAGVLHVDPRLRVMPDDPSLGEFRDEFAGMLGLMEERPDENDGGRTAFQGARRVIASETLTERISDDPDNRVDAEAFLTARLLDVFLGDWDRHRGQWRWATYDDGDQARWLPVPRDRDQAFSKFDGLATRLVSLYMPQFVRFEAEYPSLVRLHWNGRALDRWFLSGLDRTDWESVGSAIQNRLTDEVLEEAVGRLPEEIFAQNGPELLETLKARRDALGHARDNFYAMLARQVDVRATDADERVTVDRSSSGQVSVRIEAPGFADEVTFDRTFLDSETQEVRIYAEGGNDQVRVTGSASSGIVVRIIGGAGDDAFEIEGTARGVELYDAHGDNAVGGGAPASLQTKAFNAWEWTPEDRDQPRDWGRRTRPIFWSGFSSDLGLFVGGGATLNGYGFRKRPYASRVDLRGGWSPNQKTGRLEVAGEFRRENSALFGTMDLRLSGLDVVRYHGLGNASPSLGDDFHEVDQDRIELGLGFGVDVGGGVTVRAEGRISRTGTADRPDTYFGQLRDTIYGANDYDQLALSVGVDYDPQADQPQAASRFRMGAHAASHPDLLDVTRSFARAGAKVSAVLAPSGDAPVSLALQGAWEQVWGRFPWLESAFLGGSDDLRARGVDRFAGDASIFASAELRLRLLHPRVVVPVETGVFGFVETGRVYLDRESPGGWHNGVGGGLWMKPLGQEYMLRAGMASSTEATKIFVIIGLPY